MPSMPLSCTPTTVSLDFSLHPDFALGCTVGPWQDETACSKSTEEGKQQNLPLWAFLLAIQSCSSRPGTLPFPITPSRLALWLRKLSQSLDCEIALFSFVSPWRAVMQVQRRRWEALPALARAALALLALLMETFPGSDAEGEGAGPCSAPLEPQSNTGSHEGRRKLHGPTCPAQEQACRCCWCNQTFVLLWLPLSGGRRPPDVARLRIVFHEWSQLSRSLPFHLLCTHRHLRAGEGPLPPLLTLCSPHPSGESICWPCAPTRRTQLFLGSALPVRTMLPSGLGCWAPFCFPPMELPSLRFPDWVTRPRTNGYSPEDAAGVLGGRAQPPAVSRRQN